MAQRFLEGLKVLELTHMMAGPLAARRLGDLGAQVIKVEAKGGDRTRRHHGPPGNSVDGDHLRFHFLNGGKRSVELDFKVDADRELVVRLARDADVIIQNFRAGALDKHGLGYEQLRVGNPGLVYASVSGFGPGAWRDDPGQDLLVQARSGLMWLSGMEHQGPVAMGSYVVDVMAANLLVQGILAAVVHSRATGEGTHVETSLMEGALELQVDCFPMFLSRRDALPKRSLTPYGGHPEVDMAYAVFPTSDGHVAINYVPPDLMIEMLADQAEIPRAGLTNEEYRDLLLERLAPVFRRHPTAYWIDAFKKREGWISEVLNWQTLAESEGFADLGIMATEPDSRGVTAMRSPIRFDGARPLARAAPKLNEHGDEVRRLGWK